MKIISNKKIIFALLLILFSLSITFFLREKIRNQYEENLDTENNGYTDEAVNEDEDNYNVTTTSDMATELIFDDCFLNSTVAIVKKNSKYGLISQTGQPVVDFKYDSIDIFKDGMIRVESDGRSGFLNHKFTEAIPLIYEDVKEFEDGFTGVKKDGLWGVIDKVGNTVFEFKYVDVKVLGYGLFALFDTQHNWIITDQSGQVLNSTGYNEIYSFSEERAMVKRGHLWGYIDIKGSEIIKAQFDEALSFSDGMARVKLNNKYGFIDNKGKIKIPINLEYAYPSSDGYIVIQSGNQFEVMDQKGNIASKDKYDEIEQFQDGLATVWSYFNKESGVYDLKMGMIDINGNEVIPKIYDELFDFSDGLALFRLDNKYGYINFDGEVVIEPIYEQARPFCEGIAVVADFDSDTGTILINTKGEIIKEIRGYEVGNYLNGKAIIRQGNNYGFIDKTGNIIAEPIYEFAYNFGSPHGPMWFSEQEEFDF